MPNAILCKMIYMIMFQISKLQITTRQRLRRGCCLLSHERLTTGRLGVLCSHGVSQLEP